MGAWGRGGGRERPLRGEGSFWVMRMWILWEVTEATEPCALDG